MIQRITRFIDILLSLITPSAEMCSKAGVKLNYGSLNPVDHDILSESASEKLMSGKY